MNKIYVIPDYRKVPYFYLESAVINDKWLMKHGIYDFDVVETPLDLDHFEQLCCEWI